MIKLIDFPSGEPYKIFQKKLKQAEIRNQKNIDAIVISSLDKTNYEVNSRIVNLKYIKRDEWIFFSNYESPKSHEFNTHNQISVLLFWDSINTQIRIKANIFRTNSEFSNTHFKGRQLEKNALAISSHQSKEISDFSVVIEEFDETLKRINQKTERPNYWGGFTFKPFYFEFWEGHEFRLNKRTAFEQKGETWQKMFLQP